ncbi:MAG: hypothetical protein Q3986_07705 [Akkermansia sp.]|nr:hypothetical protein [Akkermansia sp.]
MKLRINAKLRAALIAAVATVGFTLPQSQADTLQLTGLTPTERTSTNTNFNWTEDTGNLKSWCLTFDMTSTSDADFFNLNAGNTASAGYRLATSGSDVILKNNAGTELARLTSVVGGSTISLSFVLNVDESGATLNTGTFTLSSGQQEQVVGNLTSSASAGNENNTYFYKANNQVRVWTNASAQKFYNFTLAQLDNNVLGTSIWQGTEGNNSWVAANFNPEFASGGNVSFGEADCKTVIVDSAVDAGKVTVDGAAYTFTLNGGSLSASNLIVTGSGASLAVDGSGTVTATAVTTGTGNSISLAEGVSLKGNTAALLQTNVTGDGAILVDSNLTLSAGTTSTATAGMLIKGATLTLGGGDSQTVTISSISHIELDNGGVTLNAKGTTINNVTVKAGKTGTIKVEDMDNAPGQFRLANTTTVEGTLNLRNHWNSQITIDRLTGAGTVSLTNDGVAQQMELTINSLEGFTGTLGLTHKNGSDKMVVNSGNTAVNFNALSVDLGGRTLAFTAAADTTIGKLTITSGGVNVTGAGALTLGALEGAGSLSTAQGITLDVANGEHSFTGTLAVGGQVVKQGDATQTISGYTMYKGIEVQGGKLILSGSYAIDEIALDEGSHVNYYNTEGQQSTSGFRSEDGSKTIYTVNTEAGAQIDRAGATFTVGGHGVDVGEDGKYLVTGTIDYNTLWANDGDPVDYVAYKTYAAGQGVESLAVRGTAGGTVNLGENGVLDNLIFDTNGITAGLAGTGTVSAFTGTGTITLREGARVTVADTTLGSSQTLTTAGPGTLIMQNLKVSGGGAVATIGSNATLHQITMGSGTVNLNGDITMERFVLSLENSASTMNIGKGANVHVTGTKLSVSNSDASFMVSNWNQVNTLNIEGRLIAEAGISARDGRANINVKDGGTLELHQGLLYMKNTAQYTNINVESGGTLLTAGNANDQAGAGLHVNLNNGSTLKGYYAEGVDTAAIAQTLTLAGTVTFDAGAAGKTLQLNSNIAGEGVSIVKTGAGALALNGNANVLYNALNVQAGTLALNGTFDLSHITHEQGTVKYFKDDQPGTEESDNGFAKYVGEVQLVNGLRENVTQGASATLTLDGYNVTYDAATGKAVSSDISLATYYINTGSETLSEIQQVSPTAGVSMKGGTTLVADANFSGSLTVTGDGNGKLVISKDKLVSATVPNQALELSGEGTYALAAGSINKGSVTLGEDWDGYLRITNFTPGNAQELTELGSALELNGFKGWDKNHWSGTMAMDIKLTDYVEGETTKVAWSCGAYSSNTPMPICTFTGAWSGTGTFKQECDASKYMGYNYQGNIADWTGAFITTCKTVLTFSDAATDVNIAISKDSGTLDLVVNNAATFTNSVAVDSTTISTSATFKNTANLGSLSGAGALTVDAGENTVTVNGISGLANTITLTSGTLSLNGTVNISEDMPVTGGNTYYIGGQDPENGFKTVEGKLQVVAIGDGSHFIEGEGISYQYGGKEIATSLTEGAITVEPTTTYGTFFVRKANTTESLEHAIQVATEASAALTAVVMSADTTLASNAEATYDLTLDEGASATVNVTAATTIGTLTGTALTINGDSTLTIGTVASAATLNGSGDLVINGPTVTINGNNKASFTGDVEVKAGTLKLGNSSGDQYVLGAYNYSGDTPRTITIRDGATIDINGHGDGNYVYTLDGGRLTNTGAGKNANNSQTVGLILTKDSFVGGEGSNEFWLRQRSAAAGGDATKLNLGEYNLTKQGNSTFGLYNTAVTGTGSLVVEGGTVNFSGGTIASNVVLNGGALAGTLVLADDITVTAKTNSTMGAGFNVGEHTLTLDTDEGKAITFSSKYTHGAGTLKADGTVKFTSGLTPNAGTVEVAGEVTVSGATLDLSNGGKSTGKVKVDGTGVLNVNSGMWMNTNAIDIAEGGTMNIAGLHIVGEADGATIATTEGNQNYGTNNDKYVITNAAVTGTTNINLGNKLVDSTLTTGAYTMTLKNAESSYDAVNVSTGGTLVIDADINLAGVLHSSGAITVNAEKSLTLTEGSSLFQTVTNSGTVSLTGITLGGGFQEQQGGEAHFNAAGEVTLDANYYIGTTESYVQVVANGDSATSTGTGILWQGTGYGLETDGRIITGHGSVNYGTYYITDGRVNMSEITALHSTTDFIVSDNGTLVVDQETQGQIHIDVKGTGTITGDKATPEDVQIETLSTAEFTKDVAGVGYEFKVGDAAQGERDTVTIKNFGNEAAKYTAENPDMMVTTQTLEMTDHENDATVTNMVMVNEVVNETGHKLTLENAASVNLKSMTIGQGSTVEALYTDAQDAQVEGTVTITESLVAGGGKLLANLTIIGNDSEVAPTLLNLGGAALTLGSTLTVDTESGLILLDDATITALEGLKLGHNLDLFKALEGTDLAYGSPDGYDGTWFDAMFVRTDKVHGDYRVYATEDSFGLTKVNNVPEPTTGTLSLLALMALAARRRKH